jgi:hypothetical protein
MSILTTLTLSGALPLNELNVRTPGSAAELLQELTLLHQGGLVDFDGQLPEMAAIPADARQIRLTRAGLRKALV